MGSIFSKAVFGRGTGLGNRLFPWARCRVFSQIHGIRMISPVWFRLAIGQFFRGGIDYRSYLRQLVLLGLFKKKEGDLGVIEGYLISRRAKILVEPADLYSKDFKTLNNRYGVKIIFTGWKKFFEPLNGWHGFLLNELRASTRKKYLDMVDSIGNVPVGICVRCGNDFKEPGNYNYEPIGPLDKTPVKWFKESLDLIRQAAGYPVKAFVVSDGTKEQLRELLEMDKVTFVRPGSAISDLLILSKSKVLLASGSSSFAAWGCFLGQMPSISHPGQPLSSIWRIKNESGQFIGEFNPLNPSDEFLGQAAVALKNAHI